VVINISSVIFCNSYCPWGPFLLQSRPITAFHNNYQSVALPLVSMHRSGRVATTGDVSRTQTQFLKLKVFDIEK